MSNKIWFNRVIFILSIFGILISLHLWNVYSSDSVLSCPLGQKSGCEIVRQSSYAYLFGIPMPSLGFFFYLALIGVSFFRTFSKNKERYFMFITLAIATFGLLFSLWLLYLELFVIGAICTWCTFSLITVFLIFAASSLEFRIMLKLKTK